MTKGEALARVMDDAARRVLSGTERPYEVAIDTAGDLVYLEEEDRSPASWSAYVLWAEISDIFDAPASHGGTGSEELCDAVASEFSREWLALGDREEQSVQEEFMKGFHDVFDQRLSEYRAAH